MLGRVVEVTGTGQHLSISRGFLLVKEDGTEKGKVPLSDIAVVMVANTAITLSAHVVQALQEHGALLVFAAKNHHPSHLVWPLAGHHQHHLRLHQQIKAKPTLHKRLWQQLVQAKIRHQGQVLHHVHGDDANLLKFAKHVQSGDPDNKEDQAARRYWKPLMGQTFRRQTDGEGVNSLLNYGYTIVRAAMARAVVASGLHPALGIHHHNTNNPYCLVDDLMEPFRPAVDFTVYNLAQNDQTDLTPDTKKQLVDVLYQDLQTAEGNSPLLLCQQKLAQSYAASLEAGKPELMFPKSVIPTLAQGLLL